MQPYLTAICILFSATLYSSHLLAENWPRRRGPDGNAVADGSSLPVRWSTREHVHWKVTIPGEGASSPIVWKNRIFVTSSFDEGEKRTVHCLDRANGRILWSKSVADENPEYTSALTDYAAATPGTNGKQVVAFFGNAGVVCYDFKGTLLWRKRFGEFDTELGLASSPILDENRVILVCDHDGDRFKTFDSFLIALDVTSGDVLWKTERPKLFRSWSTPILVPAQDKKRELIVNAQDELRGYDPETGKLLWHVAGMTGWVTPSPVYGEGMIFATSGKDGPTLAVHPGGRGKVTQSHIVWQQSRGAPYVCSPLLYGEQLYVHSEEGVIICHEAKTGKVLYRKRLAGKFVASGAAGDGKLYLTNDVGDTYVIKAGASFQLLSKNSLEEEFLSSPAIADGQLFLRTSRHLYCIKTR